MKEIVEKYKDFLDHSENFNLILEQFKNSILNSSKPIIEVGTNMGGSALCFMQILKDENKILNMSYNSYKLVYPL